MTAFLQFVFCVCPVRIILHLAHDSMVSASHSNRTEWNYRSFQGFRHGFIQIWCQSMKAIDSNATETLPVRLLLPRNTFHRKQKKTQPTLLQNPVTHFFGRTTNMRVCACVFVRHWKKCRSEIGTASNQSVQQTHAHTRRKKKVQSFEFRFWSIRSFFLSFWCTESSFRKNVIFRTQFLASIRNNKRVESK